MTDLNLFVVMLQVVTQKPERVKGGISHLCRQQYCHRDARSQLGQVLVSFGDSSGCCRSRDLRCLLPRVQPYSSVHFTWDLPWPCLLVLTPSGTERCHEEHVEPSRRIALALRQVGRLRLGSRILHCSTRPLPRRAT